MDDLDSNAASALGLDPNYGQEHLKRARSLNEAHELAQARYGRIYGQIGQRVMGKGQEARTALAHVLSSIESGVSLTELKRAIATVETHLGG